LLKRGYELDSKPSWREPIGARDTS
jgi:hypothetical protein